MKYTNLFSHTKIRSSVSILMGILFITFAIYLTYQYLSTRSQADQAEVSYSLKAGTCQTTTVANTCFVTGNINQNIVVDIDMSSGSFISGADLIFSYNRVTPGQLEFISYQDTLDAFGTEVVKEVHSHPQGYNLLHLTLVNKRDDSKLIKRAVIRLTFKGTRAGVTRFNLISSASTVVGPGASGAYAVSPQNNLGPPGGAKPEEVMKNIPNIHVTTDGSGTITPPVPPDVTVISVGPPVTIIIENKIDAKINYRLKLQGITGQPKTAKSIDFKVALIRSGSVVNERTITFTAQADGTWVADAEYKQIPEARDYHINVKGPKHLQKRICVNDPQESIGGTYRCKEGKISIKAGDNTLDFSKIYMLAGDIPLQNGIIDAVDIAYIRNNIGSQNGEVVARGDLNYDGIVDAQDYTIVLNALSFKYDDED